MTSLREKILKSVPAPAPIVQCAPAAPVAAVATAEQLAYQRIKMNVHGILIDRVELDKLNRLPEEQVRQELARLVGAIVAEERMLLNDAARKRLAQDVFDEMFGLGPLEPLLRDPTVSDILVNNSRSAYVERHGRLQPVDLVFHDDAHLLKIIERIVSRLGRRIDEASPMCDARLPDGSRVNAVIPPAAVDGPCLSIRRFPAQNLTVEDLVQSKSLTAEMAAMLQYAVHAKLNVVISGGTGSGKTTLLNLLSAAIAPNERVLTIEDAAELALRQPHVLRLETRPPNIEGKGEVTQRDLVKNALRMRPDRIVLGEVRGAEALDMLNAMNTGHHGSMTTLHANTPRDALVRLEHMVSMANANLPIRALRYLITAAVNLVVQVVRQSDGTRRVVSVQEVTGMEGEVISMQELFKFARTGVDDRGKVLGYFCATGVRPRCYENILLAGHALPERTFDPAWRVEA
ncbi:CpaF family protein [Paludibacterium sp.]|uniref:CpaF family protein n=1 Tax=Paludibacterium sp. TaxID=1917523 RepID=UPI0025DAAD67|nr:CpaF family protein [Paludibacterium sp.]MBV8648641.1 CpaF family protein [Paludibacterium sp.]